MYPTSYVNFLFLPAQASDAQDYISGIFLYLIRQLFQKTMNINSELVQIIFPEQMCLVEHPLLVPLLE